MHSIETTAEGRADTVALALALALHDDEAARAAALEIESCIVEAPAGAGKTELLTQRFLRLLATVESPEEVMAITFTNKAAAEMQKRILDNLRGAARHDFPEAPHKQLTYRLATDVLAVSASKKWQLLEQPGRLRITTIDALCASLARQMPLLSRFGASPTVTDDADAHYQEAARRTLELLESGLPEYAAPVAATLAYLDNDTGRLTHLLAAMLSRRDQWLKAVATGQASHEVLGQLVLVELSAIRRALPTAFESQLMPVLRFAADTLLANEQTDSPILALRDWARPLEASLDDLSGWRGLVEFLFTAKNEWRKAFTISVGIPAGKDGKPWKDSLTEILASAPAGLAATLARVRLLPQLANRESEDEIVAHFAVLLKLAMANLWTVFREAGETDFVEVAQRALDALGSGGDGSASAGETGSEGEDLSGSFGPSDLALRLDYRIRHLLVDEFQDTSPTQIGLLERLTAGWSPGDGRTLFCVGDPMQSIYRFRKADVGLFLRAAKDGIGGLPLRRLRLARNNRSSAPVVAWINQAFGNVFPGEDEVAKGSIAYRPSVPTRPLMAGAGVRVHLLEDSAPDEDEAYAGGRENGGASGEAGDPADDELPGREDIHRAEAGQILDIIDATWAADPARAIAVLVRAKTHLAPLVGAIRSQRPELRFAAVDVEPLAGRQWIADLVCLSHALQHRADRVSWLAVLRSPLCGLSLADLLVLAGDDHRSTLWQLLNAPERQARLSEDGQHRVGTFCRAVGGALAQAGRMPHARRIEGLWRQLGGPAGLPDASASRDVDAFFNLLGQLEARGRLKRDELDTELARLFAAPDGDSTVRLSLMTIHKAKGLEFDTVILPGLHRTVRGNDPEMLLWDEVVLPGQSDTQLIVAPMKPATGSSGGADGTNLPTAYDFLRRLEKERGRNEDRRVLYVAATRAVRALHLVGVLTRKAGGDALPPANTPLADLWPALNGNERLPQAVKVARPEKLCKSGTEAASGVAPDPLSEAEFGTRSETATGAESVADAATLPAWPDFVPALVRQRRACYPMVPAKDVVWNESAAISAPAPDAKAQTPVPELSRPGPAANAASRTPGDPDAKVGVLVHRYLELMAHDGGAWPSQRFETLRPAFRVWLAGQGLVKADIEPAAQRTIDLLRRLVDSPLGQWVLTSRADALAESAHLEITSDGTRSLAVVDRSFIDKGERWIIDYKTSQLDPAARADTPAGADLRQTLAEVHREQLARYGRLFAGESLPQRRAILFVDGPWLVELR